MKKIITLLLLTMTFMSCTEDESPNRDEIVLFSTYFKSQSFIEKVPVFDGIGGNTTRDEVRHRVIIFKQGGELEFFTVNQRNEIIAGVRSRGSYKIDYPRIYDISLASTQTETTVYQENGNLTMMLDGLKWSASLDSFR